MAVRTQSQVISQQRAANLFWNHQEERLRCGWRVLLQVLMVAVPVFGLYFPWDFTVSTVFLLATSPSGSDEAFFLVLTDGVPAWGWSMWLPLAGIVANAVGLLIIIWWVRKREGRVRLQEELAVPTLRRAHVAGAEALS